VSPGPTGVMSINTSPPDAVAAPGAGQDSARSSSGGLDGAASSSSTSSESSIIALAAARCAAHTGPSYDHAGWTSNVAPAPNAAEGQQVTSLTFARARHLVAKPEWDHWHGTQEDIGPDQDAVQRPLESVVSFVADGDTVASGVRVVATPGHTPGHISLSVEDPRRPDAGRVLVLGDVMHSQVQVSENAWSFLFDADAALAAETREQLLKDAETSAAVIAGGHFADHVFGTVLPPAVKRAWASSRHHPAG